MRSSLIAEMIEPVDILVYLSGSYSVFPYIGLVGRPTTYSIRSGRARESYYISNAVAGMERGIATAQAALGYNEIARREGITR